MVRENYNQRMEEEISTIAGHREKPRLLLHCCCAPCASHVLVRLSEFFRITAFYYNPNIEPAEEYYRRARELERFLGEYPFDHDIQLLVEPYENAPFERLARGREDQPEGSRRCRGCFGLRLHRTALLAKDECYDFFTTTLSISPQKDASVLHRIGIRLETGTSRYLPADFKKKGGTLESVRLSRDYGLYRQDYCGCIHSRKEREEQDEI